MKYSDIESIAKKAEIAEGPHGRRVTRVFSSADKRPDLWIGVYGSAPVEKGPEGYQLSDGVTVTVT
jgi:hypothetical protein